MNCCAVQSTIAVREKSTSCALRHAYDLASEVLTDLASVNVSRTSPDLCARPEYWVGHLQFALGALVVAVEDENLVA
jgi:hypothetical protein